jgi:phospholipid/cholesterol/gamma-HCH transport system substrate-binding protein
MAEIRVVASNASVITADLAQITGSIREGKGSIGKLFMDSSMATNLGATMVNLKEGTGGFKDNMEAAKHNFLLKGYFNKKEKEEKEKKEKEEKEREKLEKEKEKSEKQ